MIDKRILTEPITVKMVPLDNVGRYQISDKFEILDGVGYCLAITYNRPVASRIAAALTACNRTSKADMRQAEDPSNDNPLGQLTLARMDALKQDNEDLVNALRKLWRLLEDHTFLVADMHRMQAATDDLVHIQELLNQYGDIKDGM